MIGMPHTVCLRKQEPRATNAALATLGSCVRRSTMNGDNA